MSTTVLNAYLQTVIGRYLDILETALKARAPGTRVSISQSTGGLMSIAMARRFPIRTALSGPAAGAVGAVHVARQAGRTWVEGARVDLGCWHARPQHHTKPGD